MLEKANKYITNIRILFTVMRICFLDLYKPAKGQKKGKLFAEITYNNTKYSFSQTEK